MFTLPEIPVLDVPGDTDGDGDVDEDDAATVADHWGQTGQTGGAAVGDFNGDGDIDAADASILAGNWTGPGEATAVPEASVVMLLCSALAMLVVRRRIG